MSPLPQKQIRPQLKVFLSCDIVGSTAFKQPLQLDAPKGIASGEVWASVIQAFYKSITDNLLDAWANIRQLIFNSCSDTESYGSEAVLCEKFLGAAPDFWKTVGDEVIFEKDLETDFHLWFTLCAWNDAVSATRTFLRQRGAKHRAVLDLKSTGWIAGFPVRNKIIASQIRLRETNPAAKEVSITETTKNIEDYIGPAIDVGFRISQWSTASRFFIGLDLAYLLAITGGSHSFKNATRPIIYNDRSEFSIQLRNKIEAINIHFGGTEFLKGVLGGLNYPKFWIDSHIPGSLEREEEELSRATTSPVALDAIEKYCHKFYEDRASFIMKPFIYNRDSVTYANLYPKYNKLLRDVEAERERLGR